MTKAEYDELKRGDTVYLIAYYDEVPVDVVEWKLNAKSESGKWLDRGYTPQPEDMFLSKGKALAKLNNGKKQSVNWLIKSLKEIH